MQYCTNTSYDALPGVCLCASHTFPYMYVLLSIIYKDIWTAATACSSGITLPACCVVQLLVDVHAL